MRQQEDTLVERIRFLKSIVPVSALGQEFGRGKGKFQGEGRYICLSPFTDEKTPSFHCVDSDKFWHCFSSGKSGDIVDLLQETQNYSILEAVEWLEARYLTHTTPRIRSAPVLASSQPKKKLAKSRNQVMDVWRNSVPVADGDPVMLYLQQRGFWELYARDLPDVRYHPKLRHFGHNEKGDSVCDHTGGAMVYALRDRAGNITAIQRTWITQDGKKQDGIQNVRMSLGSVSGTSWRLGDDAPAMLVTEGMETALAAHYKFGYPARAAVSTSTMRTFVPPACCHLLYICADNDKPGITAAQRMARRLASPNLRVRIKVPVKGNDFNTELLATIREQDDAESSL